MSDSVSVVTDESTNAKDQYVLHILFVLQGLSNTFELKVILADTVNLHSVNYSSVAQGVVKCLNAFEVNFNNVTGFVSDNASYMIKAYNDILRGLLPNSVHLTCNAHIIALASNIWANNFPKADKLVVTVKKIV